MKRFFTTKRILEIALLIFLGFWLLFLPQIIFAQPPDFPFSPQQTPIDGGLVGVALGLSGWAIKKLRASRK